MIERLERGRTFRCGWVLTDDAGEAVNADSAPTVARIFKNTAATAETGTVTDQTASETGCYAVSFSPSSPVAGDFYEIVIESVIGGSTKPTKIQFVVTEKIGDLLTILGTALSESTTGRLAQSLATLLDNGDEASSLTLDQISTLKTGPLSNDAY